MYNGKKNSLVIGIAILILLVTVLSGCGNKSGQTTAADGTKLEKIIVAQPITGESWLPVYLAQQLGFFREEGLDVNFTTFEGGPLVIASLIAGDSQFALTGYDQVLKTNEKGKPTKMIVATTDKFPWTFIVAKDVKSAEDLKGKKVSAGKEGSSPRSFVRTVIKYAGLNPDKDVQYVFIPPAGDMGALEKGEVAGAEVEGSQRVKLLQRGYKPFVDLNDPEEHRKVLGTDKYHLHVVQVTDDFIKSHPDTVQKFVNAVVRAIAWENSHSSDEITKAIAPLFPNSDLEIEKSVIDGTMQSQTKDGYFSQTAHDAAVRLALDVGMITREATKESAVDETFLKKAHEEYGK